jgi:hypothetical protein
VPVPILTVPLLPAAVKPEPNNNPPLLPTLAVPVDRTTNPLTPLKPELAVWSTKSPDDVWEP